MLCISLFSSVFLAMLQSSAEAHAIAQQPEVLQPESLQPESLQPGVLQTEVWAKALAADSDQPYAEPYPSTISLADQFSELAKKRQGLPKRRQGAGSR
jgi:hypothetical protein